jgi:hypothetical protein
MKKPLTIGELEYRLLYSMVVAGKSADFAEKKMHVFLPRHPDVQSPFAYVRELANSKMLRLELVKAKTGNYEKLTKGFAAVARSGLNLQTCNLLMLRAFHGIGPKTARFFLMWTRPDAYHAALDTHVLKWIQMLGHPDIPRSTPSGAEYVRIEKIFLAEAAARKVTPVDLDSRIWRHCRDTRIGWTKHMALASWPQELWPVSVLDSLNAQPAEEETQPPSSASDSDSSPAAPSSSAG